MVEHSDARLPQHLPAALAEPLSSVLDALEHLRFGVIQLTVHDGRLTQIDITERRRFGN